MIPRASIRATAARSGRRARTSSADASSATMSSGARPTATGVPPSASARSGTSAGSAGCAGSSIWIPPSPRRAVSSPATVENRSSSSVAPRSHSTCEVASVPWPHSVSSSVGENQRSSPSR